MYTVDHENHFAFTSFTETPERWLTVSAVFGIIPTVALISSFSVVFPYKAIPR